MDISSEDLVKIAQRVKQLLEPASPKTAGPSVVRTVTLEQLVKMIDHTLLRPEASTAEIQKLCEEALQFGFFSVCVNSSNVKQAYSIVKSSPVKVCCAVGFPLGAQTPEIKALEARRALREGAKEIDMVINIGALKSKDYALTLKDIRGVVEACKDSRALSKVILETSLLTDGEKVQACELSVKAGANYRKDIHGIQRRRRDSGRYRADGAHVAPKKLGVKAAGGIRTYTDVLKMIHAGATRIGSSNSLEIIEEAKATT